MGGGDRVNDPVNVSRQNEYVRTRRWGQSQHAGLDIEFQQGRG